MSLARRFIRLSFLLFFNGNIIYAQNGFFENYPNALEIVEENYRHLNVLHDLPNDKGRIIYSIVAPEVAMYKKFMDVFETKTAEIFYANWGSDYANFSLGIFQMKPSFAEKIERDYVKFYPKGKYGDSLRYLDTGAVEIRSKRIERLKSIRWQQIYLICFYDILEKKYSHLFTGWEDKMTFYAAAYNYGYTSPIQEIKNWQSKKSFPGRGEPALISYSELSLGFFKRWVKPPQPNKDEKLTVEKEDSVAISPEKKKRDEEISANESKEGNKKEKNNDNENDSKLIYLIVSLVIVMFLFVFLKQKKMR